MLFAPNVPSEHVTHLFLAGKTRPNVFFAVIQYSAVHSRAKKGKAMQKEREVSDNEAVRGPSKAEGRITDLGFRCALGNAAVLLMLLSFLSGTPLLAKAKHEEHKPEQISDAPAAAQKTLGKKLVEAPELKRLARNGSQVSVDGAVIRGRLDLSYMVIEKQISLTNCDFQDEPDFSYSTFKQHLVLERSTFRKGARFESMTVDHNARFDGTSFLSGEAVFNDLQVHGRLTMRNAQFANGVNVMVKGAHLDKGADFSTTEFGGIVDLSGAEAHSELFFVKATFRKQFLLTTAKISGLFLTDAQFVGQAGFAGMQVSYNVKAERTVFKKRANFSEAQVGFLILSGARFESTDTPAYFNLATVAGGGFFDRVEFAGGAAFDSAHFKGDASFDQAVFDRFVSFDRARFDQAVHFEHCAFRKSVSFHEASFGALDLSLDGKVLVNDQFGKPVNLDQFGEDVELRGCTYNRIQARWQSLLRMPNGRPRLVGVDRQPYLQLQKTYEAAGDDDAANQIFLEWHHVKRQDIFRTSKLGWLIDCVPWLTSKYGVAPGRLLEMSALLLLFGMLIFSLPGAVLSSVSNDRIEPEIGANGIRLRYWDAFAVSLHQFLPIAVPFGSQWTPASDPVALRFLHRDRGVILLRMRPSTCATFLKICGYILVPLQIVVLNGLLRPAM